MTSTDDQFRVKMPAMDENHRGYNLKAPGQGSGSSSLRLPGRGPFPPLDEHLVEPEVTRDEIIGGRRIVAMPANPPHANQQLVLDQVLATHLAPGYVGAVDLLTRHDVDSDFASDACVYKEGVDPETGTRHLEELAFEVVSEQNTADVSEKSFIMHRRGVRRIFAIFVKGKKRVCEWSPESRSWRLLDVSSSIAAPCLLKPLPVAALLDAAVAANAVAEALIAQGNPVIQTLKATVRSEGKAEGFTEGRAEGRAEASAEAVLRVLAARGIAVSEVQRREILGCQDLDRLARWLDRVALASSADEVTSVS